MINELNNKRLLVLGGTAWSDIIFSFAKDNNIKLIATGSNPNKRFEEYYFIDSTNKEEMKKLILEKKIDGVYVGSNEAVIRQAIVYLSELGLPCYCNKNQWDTLMNKKKFKDLCVKFDIPVAKTFSYSLENKCEVEFPVITKPADGCGSVGITICNNYEELEKGFAFAKDKSPSGDVIVEEKVINSGMDVFFQITNGEIDFCGLGDKYSVQLAEGAGSVAGARIIPSKYSSEFLELFEHKIKKMFKYLDLKQGLIWMEVFHDGKNYYFNEVGYRPNGSLTIVSIDYFYNINTVAADMYYALTGIGKKDGFSTLILKKHNLEKKHVCEYWIACKPGKISKIDGINKLNDDLNILAVFPKYSVGDVIPHTNGFAQNFCVIHFAFDDVKELTNYIKFINNTVKVEDANGNDVIIHKTDSFFENFYKKVV